ncbi:ADL122Cp [Eremothecium gossypii ATCC 10895]|uniref:ADL122Cp n=1 Tax=Eremothecium gossypii (strain ATCC 10895 / CBS 109.51 / FGSC 9923 / NRRL Y-1056) TaxID=284811 RepID=Q75AP2_EREGS|nr:ADL122Cp [Eremothecium gossypii ATCC 10895]AAS51798.1 ADL122Cp [Eremothecium gossypii ATCC 10895]
MSDNEEYMQQLEAQRRAFEAQFGSLEDMGYVDKTRAAQSNDTSTSASESDSDPESEGDARSGQSESDEQSEMDGASASSDDEAAHTPRVISFRAPSDAYSGPSPRELRRIRSGKAPGLETEPAPKSAAADRDEKQLLEQDIELQRFLQESHIFAALNSQPSGADLTLRTIDNPAYAGGEVIGKARARTLEMRLNALSATNGAARTLETVPMNIRKGMVSKHRSRIREHEQLARDSGTVLAKVRRGEFRKIDATYKKDIERRIGTTIKAADRARKKHRDRAPRIHAVGKSTRNGLVISPKEIAAVAASEPKRRKR